MAVNFARRRMDRLLEVSPFERKALRVNRQTDSLSRQPGSETNACIAIVIMRTKLGQFNPGLGTSFLRPIASRTS